MKHFELFLRIDENYFTLKNKNETVKDNKIHY